MTNATDRKTLSFVRETKNLPLTECGLHNMRFGQAQKMASDPIDIPQVREVLVSYVYLTRLVIKWNFGNRFSTTSITFTLNIFKDLCFNSDSIISRFHLVCKGSLRRCWCVTRRSEPQRLSCCSIPSCVRPVHRRVWCHSCAALDTVPAKSCSVSMTTLCHVQWEAVQV